MNLVLGCLDEEGLESADDGPGVAEDVDIMGDGMLRLRVQITRPANDNLSCTFTINNYFLE